MQVESTHLSTVGRQRHIPAPEPPHPSHPMSCPSSQRNPPGDGRRRQQRKRVAVILIMVLFRSEAPALQPAAVLVYGQWMGFRSEIAWMFPVGHGAFAAGFAYFVMKLTPR